MSDVKIRLLGAPLVEQGGETLHFSRRKALALLAYLAVAGGRQRRESLATLLWPEQDRQRSLASLRRILVVLTRRLRKHVEADRATIALRQSEALWVDTREITRIAERYRNEGGAAPFSEGALEELAHAASLYRDDFLAGFSLSDSEGFDEWQFSRTEHFRRLLQHILETLVQGHRERGQLGRAIVFAQRWLSLDRLAEEVHRLLMTLFVEAGERSEGLRQYERCFKLLREELDVEPEPETVTLYERIRHGELRAPQPRPEPEIQVRAAPLYVLPEALTPIVGRQAELEELLGRLGDSECRLLTLVGPGGIGKTRLAIEAARRLHKRFADGICFVSLAAASDQSLLTSVTEPLGLVLDPKGQAETQLLTFLADRELLLVLDNFEHLLARAPLVSKMLAHCSRLRILATSRERLNLQGEWLLEVGGLEVPEPEGEPRSAGDFSAIQLFEQAARRLDSGFRLDAEVLPSVIQICRLLSGMPLGIELATAWLRVVPCDEIAREIQHNVDFLSTTLRDFPERHRSLRAVFQSSLQLLNEAERQLLLGLSELKGGFSREAAQRVAGADLGLLVSLLDKSLLSRSSSERYHLHELIQQFAAELLEKRPEIADPLRRRHSEYYLELLTDRCGRFASEELKEVMAELYRESENIRAAWKWALSEGRLDLLDRSLDALHQFLQLAAWYAEGEEMMGAALQVIPKDEAPLLWAKAAARQGRFNNRLGRYRKAQALLEESLQIYREFDARDEIAFAQTACSVVFFHLGDFARATELAEASVAIWRELNRPHDLANALVQLGRTVGYSGEIELAKEILGEAYELFERFHDDNGMGRSLNNLGNLYYLEGHQSEAIRMYTRCVEIFTRLGDRRGMAYSLSNQAIVQEDLGNHAEAKELSLKSLAIFKQIGYQESDSRTRGPAIPLENCGRACLGMGQYEEARHYFMSALQQAVEIQQTPLALGSLLGLAQLMIHQGQFTTAWEIVDLATRHPSLPAEGLKQAGKLRHQLEKLAEAERPPVDDQLPSIKMRMLVEELLQEGDPVGEKISRQ